jgi:NADPH:quinone reductase-like Zn-dependent oxidoreductase
MAARPRRDDLNTLAGHVEAGDLTPVIEATYSLDDIAAAHRAVASGHARGKTVVVIAPSRA